jgi:hypothetical protein
MAPELFVIAKCPQHGEEHFGVKIIESKNVKADLVEPKYNKHPKKGEIIAIIIGKHRTPNDAKKELIECYTKTGFMPYVLSINLRE